MANQNNHDKIIRYRFTAYLIKSMKSHKAKYIIKKQILQKHEELVEDFDGLLPVVFEDTINNNILEGELQNDALDKALKKIKPRDIRILLLHLLEGYSLKEISIFMDIKYNTVLSVYARTIKKIQSEMEDNTNEF